MQNTKLVKLLRTFSTREVKDFEKFILSPYFLRGRNLLPLWKVLKKFYPSFDSPQLTKEKVFKKVHPGKKFDLKSGHALTVAISEMSLLAEKFLALELIQKRNDGYNMYEYLSTALKERNLMNYALKILEKNAERIQKDAVIAEYLNEMVTLNWNIKLCHFDKKNRKEAYLYSVKTVPYLYGFTLIILSALIADHIVEATYLKVNPRHLELLEMCVKGFDPQIFEEICYDDGNGTKQIVLILYYIIKSQFDKKDESYISSAFDIYKSNFKKFSWSSKFHFLLMICTSCTDRLSLNRNKYLSMGNEAVNLAVDNKIFGWTKNEPMSVITFFTFVHLKMNLCNAADLKDFAEKVIHIVEKDQREWLHDYLFATINFLNGEYEKTLSYSSKLNPRYFWVKIRIIIMNILSLYSLKHIEEVIYNLDSFKHLIRNRPNIPLYLIERYETFLKSMQTLIKFQTNTDLADHNALNEILNSNHPYFDYWFKAEVEKLKKKITFNKLISITGS